MLAIEIQNFTKIKFYFGEKDLFANQIIKKMLGSKNLYFEILEKLTYEIFYSKTVLYIALQQ